MIRMTVASLGAATQLMMATGAQAQSLFTLDAAAINALPATTSPQKVTSRPFLQGGDTVSARVSLPANADIPPHPHPVGKVAIVTVLSGDFKVGLGDKFDDAALKTVAPGGVIIFRENDPKHFARTGNGPVELLLVAAPKISIAPAWQAAK
ncbi:Cupin domain-containing protein [Rhodopseudomonas pseudopalustris]|uniref:Cupin domain-containing protein n=2 Tax=Rhodopseudomonas pseudopalustris TaxID=1513892 RepID=A0A1H8XBH9_9BRAD|nr:Cupin domain-containing protein [Rhodopseudomonas pseudopalustris]